MLTFFADTGQTNEFLHFKQDLIYLLMSCIVVHNFSVSPCRPLLHAKLSGTNLVIGPCRVNLSVWRPNGGFKAPLGL